MAVAKNDSGTNYEGNAAGTSADLTGFTVSSGSNLLLLGILFTQGGNPSGVTMEWDHSGTPQSMTSIGSASTPTDHERIEIFKLIAPTTGNKVMHAAWSGSTDLNSAMMAIAFSGADQSVGVNAGHTVIQNTSGTAATVSVDSSTGGATVAIVCELLNNVTTDTQTEFFNLSSFGLLTAGSYALGGTTNDHTFSWIAPYGEFAAIGVHVLAASATSQRIILSSPA